MRRAIYAVTSWAGRFGSGPQRRRALHNPPAFPVDQDRRIRLIEKFRKLHGAGASMVTLDADRKLGAARIPPSACLSGP